MYIWKLLQSSSRRFCPFLSASKRRRLCLSWPQELLSGSLPAKRCLARWSGVQLAKLGYKQRWQRSPWVEWDPLLTAHTSTKANLLTKRASRLLAGPLRKRTLPHQDALRTTPADPPPHQEQPATAALERNGLHRPAPTSVANIRTPHRPRGY